ncbi:MAG: glycosyltransferase family 4 protein [Nitrospirae bacterium]|nr:glycosyltransferase family 4 protein [Nitrospirota bacterium]
MQNPLNFSSQWSRYFVDYINYDDEVKKISIPAGLKVLRRTIYSRGAKKKIKALIKHEKPDIAHLQNIHHHITPSIVHVLKKHGIPIVWTLHDYTLICPNTSFLAHGRICERCCKRKFFWPVFIKCKKDSYLASLMTSIEASLHEILDVTMFVDSFLAPSEFLRKKFIEYGFNEANLLSLGYFIDDIAAHEEQMGDFYIYVGRISEEKGVKTLIDAALKVASDGSDRFNVNKLKIVGGGPLKAEMELYAKSKGAQNVVEFLGHKSHEEVIALMKKARFIVVPSEWYENFPYVILEAFACGKAVIGSRIGGIPELVVDHETGLSYVPYDSDDLSSKIKNLLDNPDMTVKMGENARKFVKEKLNAEKHYEKLMEIYRNVLSLRCYRTF